MSLLLGSVDLWLDVLELVNIMPVGIVHIEEGSMDDRAESDPLGAVFASLTSGMSEEQIVMLRRLVAAHITFLAGLLRSVSADG
jgi:hypothetical protein